MNAYPNDARSNLTKLAAWISDRNLPFLITSIGMIVMLLWAGSYKMTAPGAEGIVPLVSNSPLIWWHFKLFGPYIGSDIIGLTEITAAILIAAGYVKPKAGIIGGLIVALMFFITSTMVITTPSAIISVPGIHGVSGAGGGFRAHIVGPNHNAVFKSENQPRPTSPLKTQWFRGEAPRRGFAASSRCDAVASLVFLCAIALLFRRSR